MTKADSIGWANGIYRLDSPPPGMDRDRIDEIWAFVKPHLPPAISRLRQAPAPHPHQPHTRLHVITLGNPRHVLTLSNPLRTAKSP